MAEHAAQPCTLIGEFPMLDAIRYEYMEHRTVGRRDGPPHLRFSLFGDALVRQKMGILEQFVRYAHAGSCNIACSETLRKLWYGDTPMPGKSN